MIRRSPHRSRAFAALLLFCVLFSLSACDLTPNANEGDSASKSAKGASDTEITRAAREKTTAATAAGQAMDTAFVHRATEENSRGDYTYIRHLAIDGDQEPVVLVVAVPAGREDAGAEP